MKTILIIYAKGSAELLNRKSALGSYIYCLSELLEKQGNKVYVNEFELADLKQMTVPNQSTPGVKSRFKKFIPAFIKQYKRDSDIFKGHKNLFESTSMHKGITHILEFYTYGSTVGVKLKNLFNVDLVTVFDSPVLEEYEFFYGKKIFNSSRIIANQNLTLKESSKIVVYSNPVRNYVGKITQRVNNVFIHQNVDFTRFDFIDAPRIEHEIKIGFIGSFLKWHRVDLLLTIFEKLAATHLNIRLYLIGDGMEFTTIETLVQNSKVKDRIELTGFCDGEQLLAFKRELHIGVMPGSNWYGAPNKIFEYGAAGLAVLAPSTPTITDLFQDKTDLLLFNWDDVDDAYKKLKNLIEDANLITRLQVNLQSKIKSKYSSAATIEFYTGMIS